MKTYSTNRMEELCLAIICEGIQQENHHDTKLKERLFEFRQSEFIPYFLMNGDIYYNNMFFLSNLQYWEKLDYADWKTLLANISDSGVGVHSFFVITYKFLKIDFIPYSIGLKAGRHWRIRSALLSFFKGPHYLQHDNEAEELMELYSLDSECLIRIRNKLLSQGAQKAQIVEPGKELGFGLGHTTIEPPSSWQAWRKDLID